MLVGAQGSGKSLFGRILGKLLGFSNVHSVSVKELITRNEKRYRTAISNSCVSVVEDVGSDKKHKELIYFALKRVTQSNELQVHTRSKEMVRINNITNYIIPFNSMADSPFDGFHRVFYFVQTPDRVVEFRSSDYMPKLWDCIENKTSEIYHWLMSIDVDKPNFPRNAPDVS